MPATIADIAAGSRASTVASWSDAAIQALYPSARDNSTSPIDGNFDATGDAQLVANGRGAIFGANRRRFALVLDGLVWLDPSQGLPQVNLVDTELTANLNTLAPKYAVDLEAETCTLELIG